MSVVVIYEELFLDQLTFVPEEQCFTYPCPCGDTFTFFVEELQQGECIATCPSCSLNVKLVLKEGELDAFLAKQKSL
ncbi:hypothetical protein BLSTO_03928 [Blastocystis sp. subtype 1]